MVKSFLISLCFILGPVVLCMASEPTIYTVSEYTGAVPGLPDEYKGLHWYRFVTKNFEILSIDRTQGVWQAQYVEPLKSWTQKRWGLANIPYDKKCLIICVPQQQLFEKWFRQKQIEPLPTQTKDIDGTARQVYAVWIAADPGFLTTKLPEQVGLVNLMNYENAFTVHLPKWMHVGMAALNNDPQAIRSMIGALDPNKSYDAKLVFEDANAKALTPADYRAQAAAACLLLRKQHEGATQFVKYLEANNKSNSEQALAVYGWHGYGDFNRHFSAYVRNLAYDIRANRTPDMGLTWFLPGPPK
jgi:hypothetical protein